MKSDGSIVDSQEDIKTEAAMFFHNFLTYKMEDYEAMAQAELQDMLGFQCDAVDSELLSHGVTEEDIKDVLFAIPSNKSP